MNHNILGVIITFAFVFMVIGISTLVAKLRKGADDELSRKIVHIGVANCWWIAMYFFDSPFWVAIPPVVFIVLNYISVKRKVFKAMERETEGYGTVFYPISLLIISIICFSGFSPLYIGGISMSCMGYGDGFAALVGNKFGKRRFKLWGNQKSLEGCITMFAVSFIASAAILLFHDIGFAFVYAAFIAIVATCLEAFTPNGYDNLTVPLGVGLFAHVII
jgi:phytol kinase